MTDSDDERVPYQIIKSSLLNYFYGLCKGNRKKNIPLEYLLNAAFYEFFEEVDDYSNKILGGIIALTLTECVNYQYYDRRKSDLIKVIEEGNFLAQIEKLSDIDEIHFIKSDLSWLGIIKYEPWLRGIGRQSSD